MPYEFPSPLNDATAVVLVAVFLIVFVTAYQALKKMTLFGTPGTFVLAGCVALLSVLGLLEFTATPQDRSAAGRNVNVQFILLPYAVLAVAIVLATLLAWISRRFQGRYSRRTVEANRHMLERSGPHGRIKDGELTPRRRCLPRVRHIHQ